MFKKSFIVLPILVLVSTFLLAFCKSDTDGEQIIEQQPLTVFCVRHAEKVKDVKDPDLTPAGKDRALELANTLRNANIQYVHSSDYVRTRETAAPTAAALGLTTEIYNPRDLESLIHKMKKQGGTHLVVGHSNTTPALVSLLGGDPHTEINEASEYDRLYIVNASVDCEVSSLLMRYGETYVPEVND